MRYDLAFPITIIKESDPGLYVCSKQAAFGLISAGGARFYMNGMIIDAEGRVFQILDITEIVDAPLLMWIKYFQRMRKVILELEQVKTIHLNEFKEIIVEHIRRYSKYWEQKDLINVIVDRVSKSASFTDTMDIVK